MFRRTYRAAGKIARSDAAKRTIDRLRPTHPFEDAYIVGSPNECIEKIESYVAHLGVNHLLLGCVFRYERPRDSRGRSKKRYSQLSCSDPAPGAATYSSQPCRLGGVAAGLGSLGATSLAKRETSRTRLQSLTIMQVS